MTTQQDQYFDEDIDDDYEAPEDLDEDVDGDYEAPEDLDDDFDDDYEAPEEDSDEDIDDDYEAPEDLDDDFDEDVDDDYEAPEEDSDDDEAALDGSEEEDFDDLDDDLDEDSTTPETISEQFKTIADEITISSSAFSLSDTTVSLDSLVFLKPLRDARRETHSGLLTSIKEMGMLQPLWVSPTENYQDHLASGDPDAPFLGPKFRVLDGLRRIFVLTKLGVNTAKARVVTFDDPELGAEMSVVFSRILNRTQRHSWGETWGLMQTLEMQAAMTPATLEWLLNLEPGNAMKMKDVMLCDYPEVIDAFLSKKKTLDQAYNALQKLRKEEDATKMDDTRSVDTIEGAEGIISDSSDGATLSDDQVKELLEMSAPSEEADDLSEENFGGDGGMFGEAAEDHVQDTKEREAISPELRSSIFRRDDFTCQGCGRGKGISSNVHLGLLEAHHITAVYTGGSDSSKNFVTLCVGCHSFVHILAGFNGKIGMSEEEFSGLSEFDQSYIKNCVRYARVLLEAEKRSGKSLKKYKPTRLPFWTRQAESQKVMAELAKDNPDEAEETEEDDFGEDEDFESDGFED